MEAFFDILFGIAAGAALLLGAIWLAIRPYNSGKKVKPWMADPSGERDTHSFSPGDGGPGLP